jgi:hypothetical protein
VNWISFVNVNQNYLLNIDNHEWHSNRRKALYLMQKNFLFWNLIKQWYYTNCCADRIDFWVATNHSNIFLSPRISFGIGSLRNIYQTARLQIPEYLRSSYRLKPRLGYLFCKLRNAGCFKNPSCVRWQQTAYSRLLPKYNVYLLGFCQHQEQVRLLAPHTRHVCLTFWEGDTRLNVPCSTLPSEFFPQLTETDSTAFL